ncbi:MAG: PKD domain-containing protein [Flavobacterium sp.]|nr:PKD domain-containing protein [Flavobacterium sp.]
MKKILLVLFTFICTITWSQVSYQSNNFATAGNTYLVSNTTAALSGLDFTQTGTAYNWDYAALQANTQETISWDDPNNSGYKPTWCLTNGYVINCNTQFNTQFNLANQQIDGIQIQGYGLTNVVNHYFKSATTLECKMVGASLTVSGITVPFTFDYTIPDAVYNFPIVYNDSYTNHSEFEIDLSSLGFPIQYESQLDRTNFVEGWGSLTTPYGTFSDVLKMKTTEVSDDTIITPTDTVSTQRTVITYKWFDVNFGIPVLEVSGDEIAGVWTPTSVTYIDNPQCLTPVALFVYAPLLNDYDPTTQQSFVSFINTSTNYDSVLWDFGDGTTSTDVNPSHTYTCPGNKQVSLTVTNEFCDPDLIDTITIPLSITDSQNAFTTNVTISNGTLIADRNLSGTTYQWIDCDNGNSYISGETNQSFTPSQDGNYAVQLTTNGCVSVSDCISTNFLTSTNFEALQKDVVIYPNPTNGVFEIKSSVVVRKIEIYNALGMLIATESNLNYFNSGIYNIKVYLENDAVIYKQLIKY